MKIEAGKFYRNEVGVVFGPMRLNEMANRHEFPWTDGGGQSWKDCGYFYNHTPSPADLVAECDEFGAMVEPAPVALADYRPSLASPETDLYAVVAREAVAEVRRAREMFGPMASMHEGYAVILEELDEVWDIVKMKQKLRDLPAARKEIIQVAAMCIAFAAELCTEERGRR